MHIYNVWFYLLVGHDHHPPQRNHDWVLLLFVLGAFIGAWYWPRGRSSSVGSIRPGSGAGELEPGCAKPRGEAEESRRMRSRANGGEARWRGPKGNLSWVKMSRSEHPAVSCSWGWFNWEEFVVGFLWFDGRVVEFCHGRSRLWPVYWLLMDVGACEDVSMPQNMGIVCLQKPHVGGSLAPRTFFAWSLHARPHASTGVVPTQFLTCQWQFQGP